MDITTQLQTALRSHSLPIPSHTWLQTLSSSRTPPPPLASLIATARTRLLASDLTTPSLLDSSYVATHALPANLAQQTSIPESRLGRDVVVQVLDVENLSRSRWEQVEELEAIERGEQTRGRQVIRLPAANENGEEGVGVSVGDAAATQTQAGAATQVARESERQARNATHKLVLQDCKGAKIFGIELVRVERIAIGKLNIGEKVLIRAGTRVARGVLLLEPAQCLVLGGKVEAWHKPWMEERLARLRDAVGADRR
ncbi:hypothetical protein B0T22DRAFT_181124 [Podospora appendiculata]|uniref:RecQ-mediated genome instability protein 1 n=1 Tax=Podospora appendiculata TaxID=314037 RepID=A0AAE0XCP2_9PEZI|nr:hypothetical protein B0T22DRAFT_181124 [Podospora appendiculata]